VPRRDRSSSTSRTRPSRCPRSPAASRAQRRLLFGGIDCDFALTGDARADRNEGRRDAWLRLLDRLGLRFDS